MTSQESKTSSMPAVEYYRWQVIGALSMVIATSASVSFVSTLSKAMSANHIVILFTIQLAIVILLTSMALQPPAWREISRTKLPWWLSMDNPFIAIPFSLITSMLTYFVFSLLGLQ